MGRTIRKLIFTLLVITSSASALCTPIPGFQALALSTFCWHCMLPIVAAGVPVMGPVPDPTMAAGAYMVPMSVCPTPTVPPLPRPCVNLMYWSAPVFHEVVNDAGCFPSLGFYIPMPTLDGSGGETMAGKSKATNNYGTREVNTIAFAPAKLLDLLTDIACVDPTQSFDVLGTSIFIPQQHNDALANMVAPEVGLYANVPSGMLCTLDAISAQFFTSNSWLTHCIGSWGESYPFTVSTSTAAKNNLEAANGIAAKNVYYEHRMLLAWDVSGRYQTCFKLPMPIWNKNDYRYQLISPLPNPFGHTIGQSSDLWGLGRDIPLAEDAIFVLFKRRGCCMLSDERLKTNIVFREARNGFNIYTWDWTEEAKAKYGQKLYEPVGVIAQQVKEVYPEAVSENEEGYLTVDYKMLSTKMDFEIEADIEKN